jgi:PhnB protein
MKIQSYLNFEGRAEEALEFYSKAAGAQPGMIMRMKDSPEPHPGGMKAGTENKIMHCEFTIGESMLFATDGFCSGKAEFKGVTLSLQAADEAEAQRLFKALADGGTITMPMGKTFFSPCFGMLQDRFGVSWMVIVHAVQ